MMPRRSWRTRDVVNTSLASFERHPDLAKEQMFGVLEPMPAEDREHDLTERDMEKLRFRG